jgi:Domain of unknown function (DU1801)
MRSEATTVEQYLSELPQERADAIKIVRQLILDNLAPGFVESMNFGMIAYEVPLEVYADTYNKQPLMYAALASQKNSMVVYLNCIYSDPDAGLTFKEKYVATGKRCDVGKSCVRFRKLDALPLELVAEYIASHTMQSWISLVDGIFKERKAKKKTRK